METFEIGLNIETTVHKSQRVDSCTSHFSAAVTKHHGVKAWWQEQEAEGSHLEPQAQFKPSKPTPNEILSLERPATFLGRAKTLPLSPKTCRSSPTSSRTLLQESIRLFQPSGSLESYLFPSHEKPSLPRTIAHL